MASFITNGPGWVVEDIGDIFVYPVFALWHGKRLCGVAGGTDGREELLTTAACSIAKEEHENPVKGQEARVQLTGQMMVQTSVTAGHEAFSYVVTLRFDGEPEHWIVEKVKKVRVADKGGTV